ncbi:MAG: hypothetical protein HYV08_07985 [Deltaproteobacteria bacterium]|nr:hypothetical protein [Deltaproteobacteria bacterium]MBI3079119.1 hypothetical protein [Deltaproteobacteria bacterium]
MGKRVLLVILGMFPLLGAFPAAVRPQSAGPAPADLKLADVAVLSDDLMSVPEDRIRDIKVVMCHPRF